MRIFFLVLFSIVLIGLISAARKRQPIEGKKEKEARKPSPESDSGSSEGEEDEGISSETTPQGSQGPRLLSESSNVYSPEESQSSAPPAESDSRRRHRQESPQADNNRPSKEPRKDCPSNNQTFVVRPLKT